MTRLAFLGFVLGLLACGDEPTSRQPGANDCTDDPSVCDANATCTPSGGGRVCVCNQFYRGDGITCEGPLTCADNPCFTGVVCTDLSVGYECGPCPDGYQGDGTHCVATSGGDECTVAPGLCSPTALPAAFEVDPVSHGHANYGRLDATHIVVAYAQLPDRTTPPSEYHIRLIEFDGTTVTPGAVNTFTYPVNPPNDNHALRVIGRLDDNHFLMVMITYPYENVLHLFDRTGDTVTLLETINIGGGYFGGHPIDDGRFLLRYRESTWSNSQVRYRVARLNGSSLVLGPELDQLPPSDFPGLDPGEPQTFSPVARIGPTTFREIRAGYVYQPGYLAAWTITVNPDDTLTAASPQVFDSSETRSIGPMVAANGTGEGVVLYQSYDVDWFWGGLANGMSTFTPGGVVSDTSSWIGYQAQESTDGYINGRYYIRSQNGNLFRFDSLASAPVAQETDLAWGYCGTAPSTVRMGNFGVFLVCDGSNPLTLEFLPL